MDADWFESQRDQFLSQREKRWSMNSQRLEEIVAELMKPIGNDNRRSFDTDLSALLEEYLTEAGLRALDADEGPCARAGDAAVAVPNFAEIALLLQQSASIYGRKVDFLYSHVLSVSDSLLNATQELATAAAGGEGPQTPQTPQTVGRRRRRASVCAGAAGAFEEIVLEACAGAAREAEAPRAPPTLARAALELEPRAPAAADAPLLDYAGEHIGLLADFHVAWRLQDGLLVDELASGPAQRQSECRLRPPSLLELQAALEARAPPPPPPLSPRSPHSPRSPRSPRLSPPPLGASTPLPEADVQPSELMPGNLEDPPPPPPPPPPAVKKERKRRSDVNVEDIFNDSVKITFDKDLMRRLKEVREFTVDKRWIEKIVGRRKVHILSERRRLADELDDCEVHDTQPPDKGFAGWSSAEASAASASALSASWFRADDSDDDEGFFSRSSSGGCSVQSGRLASADGDGGGDSGGGGGGGNDSGDGGGEGGLVVAADDRLSPAERQRLAELAAWKASIVQRAAAAEARGTYDVHELGARVLAALPARGALPVARLLREQARHPADVSRLVLATLFLANTGNLEIEQGPPLSLGAFALRLLSTDARRYRLAAERDALPAHR